MTSRWPSYADCFGSDTYPFRSTQGDHGVTLIVCSGLTAIQLFTDSDALALLFPWRSSVWLVPTAATVVLASASAATAKILERSSPI